MQLPAMAKKRSRQRTSYEDEGSRLRKLASTPGISLAFSRHAEDEMRKDGIVKLDIANMLKRCMVTKIEDCRDETSWRAEGKDNDGRKIAAEVVVYEDRIRIKIVTAWVNRK
ncbi:hypothetical protein T281_15530 [Rhodomicrobium udaipurense JA643]|nr:hypothetical protein T281_15530 [Rhodomicrobium udaipurense JA643]